MPATTWYYDFISPFAYLHLEQHYELLARHAVTPVPVLFGALLAHHGNVGPAEIDSKRIWTYRYCQWFANTHGIDFRFPDAHPFNPIGALRLAVALDADLATVRRMFRVIFATGLRPDTDAGFAALVGAVDAQAAAARTADDDIKLALRQNTERAAALGVFGVPSLVVNDVVFWGNDGTAMYLDYLDKPMLFADGEMQRIASLPVGISRNR